MWSELLLWYVDIWHLRIKHTFFISDVLFVFLSKCKCFHQNILRQKRTNLTFNVWGQKKGFNDGCSCLVFSYCCCFLQFFSHSITGECLSVNLFSMMVAQVWWPAFSPCSSTNFLLTSSSSRLLNCENPDVFCRIFSYSCHKLNPI